MDRSDRLNFSEPSVKLMRTDDRELRGRILSPSQSDARKIGNVKSVLHHLRGNANSNRAFTIYGKLRSKLEHNDGRLGAEIAE